MIVRLKKRLGEPLRKKPAVLLKKGLWRLDLKKKLGERFKEILWQVDSKKHWRGYLTNKFSDAPFKLTARPKKIFWAVVAFKKRFWLLTFSCYYCFIGLKSQSEHSGLRPDTSSLVYFKFCAQKKFRTWKKNILVERLNKNYRWIILLLPFWLTAHPMNKLAALSYKRLATRPNEKLASQNDWHRVFRNYFAPHRNNRP